MMYTPLHVVTFIRDALQAMFAEYGGENFAWNSDRKQSKIDIGTVNDLHKDSDRHKTARVLVQRGAAMTQTLSLSDNLNETINGGIARGGSRNHRQDIQGTINIIVEARQEGTCEEVAEFTRRFICWSKPYIEKQFGFQAFAKQLSVSECMMDREDTEKFKITINIPFIVEDHWQVSGDLIKINHIFNQLTKT